ncbi:MAG: sulfatase-like hydrolase/transferase, partial [Bryobacterales bacterium]|nr:sulfatase-like hydrolase/transferase [Bryobacterales bacterium]
MTGPTRRTLLASLAAGACASAPASPLPNILFILPDQVRPRDLSINGGDNVATPHIDSLAKEGVSFTNA